MALTDRVQVAIANPATDDEFDVHGELTSVLAGIGMSAEDAGGAVTFQGADPVVPSTLRLAAAAGLALTAKSVVMAKLWRLRGGPGQDISMDLRVAPRRLCPFYERRWEKLNGFSRQYINGYLPMGTNFYQAGDGRWMSPNNPYPNLALGATKLLGCANSVDQLSAAIAGWKGRELEEAGAAAGIVMPMVRSTEEFLNEPQYLQALADAPLIEITKIGESDPEPLPYGGSNPLDGIRALGMANALAGASTGRALALHGADVLNIWRPSQVEHDALYIDGQVGVRQTMLEPNSAEGMARIRMLLSGADVFYANRRPGYLDRIGLSAAEAAELRPGIVYATASAYGNTGPWAERVGFDQSAGSVSGIMVHEGSVEAPKLTPIVVVNDNITAWLLATGVAAALDRRAREGGSYQVHVSLAGVSLWMLSMGIFDKEYAAAMAGSGGEHAYAVPETFTARTPLGDYQGVTDQVRMSQTPGAYRHILVPRGSSRPEWLFTD